MFNHDHASVAEPAQSVKPSQSRILVVDDNAVNVWVMQELLRKHGYTDITQLDNGRKAVDKVTSGGQFDLILMDLHMPVLGGYEATQEIRAWETAQGRTRVTIVAMTADVYEEVRRRCLAGGIDGVLTKPIFIHQLLETLTRWLP